MKNNHNTDNQLKEETKRKDWKVCKTFWSPEMNTFVTPIQMETYAFDVGHLENTTEEESRKISEIIVTAVNSYEPMLKLLKEIQQLSVYDANHDNILYNYKAIADKVDSYLKSLE